MAFDKLFLQIIYLTLVYSYIIKDKNENFQISEELRRDNVSVNSESGPDNVFSGVYFECFIQFSFSCLQKKTLLYLKELNKLNEISVIGDYVKFVKLNTSGNVNEEDTFQSSSTDELSYMIDRAVDHFFDNHLIRFRAMGRDVLVPNEVEEFVGRKKRKGGGGGGSGDGGDGGKKKMMMMVMMCMKMKLMMMLPAMMGMMGMMSFKGMMFSMMSFMISKMMLLMKILEKKGGGGGGGGGDGGWAAGGGGGGAWMPAGGQDYGGGGYDANGQWQSRSIIEKQIQLKNEEPIISYVKPTIRYNNKDITKIRQYDGLLKANENAKPKSRKKRGIIDALQNVYLYWTNKFLGISQRKSNQQNQNHYKYKLINGVKYVYHPVRSVSKVKSPKELKPNAVKVNGDELKPIIVDDFNKGEIMEGPIESRMMRKKMNKMKEVSDTVDDNPWQ